MYKYIKHALIVLTNKTTDPVCCSVIRLPQTPLQSHTMNPGKKKNAQDGGGKKVRSSQDCRDKEVISRGEKCEKLPLMYIVLLTEANTQPSSKA